MGKSVAKLLAKKGANVVVASRTVAKLEAALEEVKVSPLLSALVLEAYFIQGFSNPSIPTISLHRSRSCTGRQRGRSDCQNYHMERWTSSRRCMVHRWILIPQSLHRYPSI